MAKEIHTISDLTPEEYKAALAAVKLIRGEVVKNAFLEGWAHGFNASQTRYYGGYMSGDHADWNKSQAKMLETVKHEAGATEMKLKMKLQEIKDSLMRLEGLRTENPFVVTNIKAALKEIIDYLISLEDQTK